MNEHYQQTPEELYQKLDACPEGLSAETAAKHLEQYGKMPSLRQKDTHMLIFLEQFKDFLVIILIIAALISAFTGDLESFIVIIAVITMNAILGTVQTVKAEKSLSNLKKLSSPTAKVLRDGQTVVLPAEEVTVGDLVLLEAGDQIPADGRLVDCASLQTNESALTGESTNVEKTADCITGEVPLAERKNMVYSGGFVTYGRGVCLVTEVGMQTEVGKIASLIQNAEARKTPLQMTLDQFGKRLSIGIMIVCALVFVLSMIRVDVINFDAVMDSLMFAIALAVAAIPERSAPSSPLSRPWNRETRRREHAIIKDLKAVESLGCVSVICSDKTGTLTQNRMETEAVYINGREMETDQLKEYAGSGKKDAKLFLMAAALNNNTSPSAGDKEGDPVELALFHMVQAAGAVPEQLRLCCPRKGRFPLILQERE